MINKNSIPNQRLGEEVVIHLRRHWFIFFKLFLFFVTLALIPVIILLVVQSTSLNLSLGEISYAFLLVLALSYYLVMMVFAFTAWTEAYLDVWTLTTYRIINREQNGLFNRVVSDLYLSKIQDVTAQQRGFFATILHYGDVHIQSAGAQERFVFEHVPQPYKIAKIIQKLNDQAKKDEAANQSV